MKVTLILNESDVDVDKKRQVIKNERLGIENKEERRMTLDFSFRRELLENFYIEPEGERDIMAVIRGIQYRIVNTPNTLKKLNIELNGDV